MFLIYKSSCIASFHNFVKIKSSGSFFPVCFCFSFLAFSDSHFYYIFYHSTSSSSSAPRDHLFHHGPNPSPIPAASFQVRPSRPCTRGSARCRISLPRLLLSLHRHTRPPSNPILAVSRNTTNTKIRGNTYSATLHRTTHHIRYTSKTNSHRITVWNKRSTNGQYANESTGTTGCREISYSLHTVRTRLGRKSIAVHRQ